jgi:mannonate dehydratase
MDIGLRMDPEPSERWELARQLGLSAAVSNFPATDASSDPWSIEALRGAQERFADAGFEMRVVEHRPPMTKTVLGEPGRDDEIAEVKRLLRNMGELGIETYCWVWTENPLGVLRTGTVEDRGGSIQTEYDHATKEAEGEHPDYDITEAELWANLEHFLDEVVPVAEEAGVKMALHPDDPPISPIRGVPRIITSVAAYDRVLSYYDSPNNGVTFCQGNFSAMGADIPDTIRHFGEKIHFVHFRDVAGDPDSFVETWHEDGPTDMAAAMQAYRDIGFDGVIRPDHVAEMAGEDGGDNKGRLFAVGYMKGLLDALA